MGALTLRAAALLLAAGSAAPGRPAAPPSIHVAAARVAPAPLSVTVPHAQLRASVPAEGDTLGVPPEMVRLEYTEPVDAGLARVLLVRPDGALTELEPRGDPRDVHAIIAKAPALAPGGYRVAWRVVSADGHPVSGSFVFFVAVEHGAIGPAPPDPGIFDGHGGRPAMQRAPRWLGPLRGAASAALLGLAGLLAIGTTRLAGGPRRGGWAGATGLAVAATVLLVADAAAWSVHATGLPFGAAVGAVLGSAPGRLLAVRIAAAALALWALALARRPGIAAVFAGIAVLAGAGIGHAAADTPVVAVPAKALHLALAALWFGGLISLVADAAAALRGDGGDYRERARRVSRIALIAVTGLALTGVVQTALLLPNVPALWTSGYGLLVLGKAGGLAALVAIGALNRFRLLPALDAGGSPAALRRAVAAEIAILIVVVLLAGVLAYTPPAPMPAAASNL